MPKVDTKKAVAENKTEQKQSVAESILTTFLLLVIFALIAVLPAMMIYFNVKGVGETVRPYIRDIPYLNKILPVKPDPLDPKYMNRSELEENFLAYKTKFEESEANVEELKGELETYMDLRQENEAFLEDKRRIEETKEMLDRERQDLQQEKAQFYADVANGNKIDYKSYYESIDRDMAAKIYEDVLKQEQIDANILEYISKYESMPAASAAAIFDEMMKTSPEIVTEVVTNMKKARAADVIAAMTPTNAKNLTEAMYLHETKDTVGENRLYADIREGAKKIESDTLIKEYVTQIESMEPEKAAALMDEMIDSKPDATLYLFTLMDAQKAGSILSFMKPESAAKLTTRIYLESNDPDRANQLYNQYLSSNQNTDNRIKQYVAYFENMNSQDAARMFENMEREVVVNIFRYMDNKGKAAEILSSMNSTVASEVANTLSQRYGINFR